MQFILSSFSRPAYTFVYSLLLPLVLLRLLVRSIKAPDYRKRMLERLGFFKAPVFSKDMNQPIVIHAVSVGENIAVLPVIRRLLVSVKDTPLVVTSTTPTGSEQIKSSLKKEISEGKVFHVYLPYDLPVFLRRFFEALKPQIMLMVETELWPNTLAECKKRNIKTSLINARLSERSFKAYSKLDRLVYEMVNQFDLILAQDDSSAQRFIKLGISENNVVVTGNVKFDFNLTNEMREQALFYKKMFQGVNQSPLLIAASTHKGEDVVVLNAFTLLSAQRKKLDEIARLIIVPRHLERFSSVKALSKKIGFNTIFLSDLMASSELVKEDVQVIVVDKIGMLAMLFGAADVALVCGSLLPNLGGHNLIEPAAWGVPVLSGPSMFNFQQISDELVEFGDLKIVNNAEELKEVWQLYLSDKLLAQQSGAAAKEYQLRNQGALEKMIRELTRFLLD